MDVSVSPEVREVRVLFSPLGLSYGSLFSAILLTKPDEVVVVTSEQGVRNLAGVLEAAARYHRLSSVHHFLLSDPFTGFAEGRALARQLAKRASKENIVNLVGGTTAMQDCMTTLAQLIPCRQVAVIDRRPVEEQRANPFVVGELAEVPRVTDAEREYIDLLLEALLAKAKRKGLDVALLERAFAFAEEKHRGQQRDCGSLHLGHVVRVCATLLFEFELANSELLAAGLLHDILEDCYPAEEWEKCYQTLSERFGRRVADIVRLVTKRQERSEEEEAEIDRRYLDGLRNAPGNLRSAVFVKLADRLDNLRSVRFVAWSDKREKYARKTERLYLVLAEAESEYAGLAFRSALERLESSSG